jgi:hypothetical protein
VVGLLACVCATAPAAQAAPRPEVATYRVVQQLRLDEGQSGTYNVSCRHGDLATDGIWQIDALDSNAQLDDERFDLVSGVDVLEADSISTSGYRFALRNNTEGIAQLRLAVVCVTGSVSDGTTRYALRLSAPVTATAPIGYGTEATQQVTCPTGAVAVTPGFRLVTEPGGVARTTTSFAVAPDLRTLERRAFALADVQLTMTARCLSVLTGRRSGKRWRLGLALRTAQATIADGRRETYTVSCRPGESAITGAFSITGGWYIGQFPAGRQRTFRAQSPLTGTDGALQFGLLCLGDRAKRPI